MTIIEYGKKLKSLQWLVFGLPLVSSIFDRHTAMPFPPMGDNSAGWRFFAMAIIGVSAFLPYFLLPLKRRVLAISGLFLLFVLAVATYLTLEESLLK